MASTTFTDQVTPVTATWLNEVNAYVHAGTLPSDATGAPYANRNVLFNGDFSVWQRGTSFSNPATKATSRSADRWNSWRAGFATGITGSRQASGLTGYQYCLRTQRTAANATTDAMVLSQSLESVDSIPLQGKTVTVSAYARAGANFSGANAQFVVTTGTGTDQSNIDGYTGSASTQGNFSPTTAWTRFTFSTTIPTTATEVSVNVQYTPVGVAGAADYLEITGVQLEVSPFATTFEQIPFAVQLQKCKRYFQKTFPYATAPAQNTGATGGGVQYFSKTAGVSDYVVYIPFGVVVRSSSPTITFYNPSAANAKWRNLTSGADSATAVASQGSDSGFSAYNPQIAGDGITNSILVHYSVDAEL